MTISSGITVGTLKDTSIGDVKGRDSLQATELGRSEHPSFSECWKYLAILHEINVLLHWINFNPFTLSTPSLIRSVTQHQPCD
jgi:hypothetical protein